MCQKHVRKIINYEIIDHEIINHEIINHKIINHEIINHKIQKNILKSIMDKKNRELHRHEYHMNETHNNASKNYFEKTSECSLAPSTAYNIVRRDIQSWTDTICQGSALNCNNDNVKQQYCSAATKDIKNQISNNIKCQRIFDHITDKRLI